MAFKTDLEIELQRNCNLARWNDLGKLKKEHVSAYELGWNDFKRMLYDPLRKSQKPCTSDEALHIANVVGRSEQLKAEVFKLANKLAVAGEGDAAVAMHRIHNRL